MMSGSPKPSLRMFACWCGAAATYPATCVLEAASGLLSRAQERGTARADLTVGELVQLVIGIALSTAGDGHAEPRPHRLLDLVLDAVHGSPRRNA
ncbi:hypothetical protein [Streptomyces sp. NPDC058326]|uniref:SbtR family transcriptional regulator n=1 Tax=Streptomyces sp. NPDC058326 TaxID=3346447 RepID=UPI0036EBF588